MPRLSRSQYHVTPRKEGRTVDVLYRNLAFVVYLRLLALAVQCRLFLPLLFPLSLLKLSCL